LVKKRILLLLKNKLELGKGEKLNTEDQYKGILEGDNFLHPDCDG
jgi:hypothetical protein